MKQETKAKSEEGIGRQSQPQGSQGQPQSAGGPARPSGPAQPQGRPGYPANRQGQPRPSGRPANPSGQSQPQGSQGQPQSAGGPARPSGQAQPQGRPGYPANRQSQPRPSGRPANPSGQPQPQGRPGYPQSQGYPANRQGQPRPSGRPVNPSGQSQPQNRPNPYGQNARMPSAGPYGQTQARGPYRPQGQYMQGVSVQRRGGGRAPAGMFPDPAMLRARLIERSKKMFRSPVFLLIALMNTVFMVTTIASVFLQEMSFSQVINILANFDAPSELMSYANRLLSLMSGLGSGMIVISLISHLPEILLCVGFWMLVVTAKNNAEAMPGIGFLCVKIYIVIKMVVTCVALLVCLVMSVVFVVSAWVSAGRGTQVISVIFLVLVIVAAMMIIMYFFCMLHNVRVCRTNAVEGEEFSSMSRYAAVLTILAALTSILGLLSAIVNAETAGIVSFGCKIGWMVLTGLWIFMYRRKVSAVPAPEGRNAVSR